MSYMSAISLCNLKSVASVSVRAAERLQLLTQTKVTTMSHLIELQYEGRTILVEAEMQEDEIRDIGAKKQIRKVEAAIEDVSAVVALYAKEISRALEISFAKAIHSKSITLELGLKFTGSGDVFVAKVAAEAGLKITLTWDYGDQPDAQSSE